MPKCLQMSLHFGGIQQSQTASNSDRLFSYCACVAFLVSTRFSEYPSHCEVNSIQLLHPACPPSSMLYPATKICPFLWRCLLFSFQFFLLLMGLLLLPFSLLSSLASIIFWEVVWVPDTMVVCMGHASFANSKILANSRPRISNIGNRYKHFLHAKE